MGRFSHVDEQYQSVKAATNRPPDGMYSLYLKDWYLTVTKGEVPRDKLAYVWTINGPERRGATLFMQDFFDSPEALSRLKANLEKMGAADLKPSDIEDPMKLRPFIGVRMSAQVKTKGDFQNVYLRKILDGRGPETGTETQAATATATQASREPGSDDEEAPF